MKVFELIINEFRFIPIAVQFLEDTNITVILYQLVYKNKKIIVPYYISNGHTNHLRANLVFPFMCISINDENCPKKKSSQNELGINNKLLVKYQIIENVNLEPIHKYIDDKIKELPGQELLKLNIGKNLSGGLKTVISRLKNIIDLFICVCYIDVKRDSRKYRPVFDKKQELNMDYIEDESEPTTIKDIFRETLVKYLKSFYKNIKELGFIQINESSLRVVSISTEDFNNQSFISVCPEQQKKDEMIQTYGFISEEFRKYFIQQINLLQDPILFLNLCNYMFSQKSTINDLSIIMKQFDLECKSRSKSPRRSRSRSPRRSRSRSPRK